MLSIILSVKPWDCHTSRSTICRCFNDLPTAVDSFSPCNRSLEARNTKPAGIPPAGPPAKAAIVVGIPTAILALPGFSFAQSLTFCIPCTILLSLFFAVISFLSCSNFWVHIFYDQHLETNLPSSLIFLSTAFARSTGSLATARGRTSTFAKCSLVITACHCLCFCTFENCINLGRVSVASATFVYCSSRGHSSFSQDLHKVFVIL